MIPTVVTSKAELVEVIRRRRDELGITHATIDAITGWADGYCSKLMCDPPMKNFGEMSLGLVLGALALGIARVEIVEDPAQAERVRGRWVKRKRPFYALERSASLISVKREETPDKSKQVEGFALMQILGRAGGKASGKKRRAIAMRRRALQRVRAHAARARWEQVRVHGGALIPT